MCSSFIFYIEVVYNHSNFFIIFKLLFIIYKQLKAPVEFIYSAICFPDHCTSSDSVKKAKVYSLELVSPSQVQILKIIFCLMHITISIAIYIHI